MGSSGVDLAAGDMAVVEYEYGGGGGDGDDIRLLSESRLVVCGRQQAAIYCIRCW